MLNKAHVIEIAKTCITAFMKAKNSLVVWCREKKKKQKMVKIYFLKLLLKFFANIKKLFNVDFLSDGFHEKVTTCYIIMLYY